VDCVSVLLPVRPNPRNLRATVQSIASQSFPNWELIALLDRDSGQNEKILRDVIDESQIRIVECNVKEFGFSATLNTGIEACSFNFIARQDDDDISFPDRLEKQISILGRCDEAVLVTGWAEVVDVDGNHLYNIQQPEDSQKMREKLTSLNIVPHSSVMFRRDAVQSIGGYRQGMDGCEDYDLWLRLMCRGKVLSTGSFTVQYLKNPEGMTKTPLTSFHLREIRKSQRCAKRYLGISAATSEISVWNFSLRQKLAQKVQSRKL
jgi:glycosyltransferase involved in cell wall biosynthesis